MGILTKIYLVWVHICASGLACWSICVLSVGACGCASVRVRPSVCVCVGRPKHHCAAATTGPPSPPTRHNKEQLNAAALPAEEPTTSHTSTNRQICLKPKGRSNKSQPTGSPFRWFEPEGDRLASPYHSLSLFRPRCDAVLHVKLAMLPCSDASDMVSVDYTICEVKN